MKTKLIPLVEGQGIRISKRLLDEAGLSGEVELRAERGAIMITSGRRPRAGWNEAFAAMAARGDDTLPDPHDTGSQWDHSEWEW